MPGASMKTGGGPKVSVACRAKSSGFPSGNKAVKGKGPSKTATSGPRTTSAQDTPQSVTAGRITEPTVSSSLKRASKPPSAGKLAPLPPYGGDGGLDQKKPKPKKKAKSRSSSVKRPARDPGVEDLQAVVAKLQQQVNQRNEEREAAASAHEVKEALEKERHRADVLSQILLEQDALLKEALPTHSGQMSPGVGQRFQASHPEQQQEAGSRRVWEAQLSGDEEEEAWNNEGEISLEDGCEQEDLYEAAPRSPHRPARPLAAMGSQPSNGINLGAGAPVVVPSAHHSGILGGRSSPPPPMSSSSPRQRTAPVAEPSRRMASRSGLSTPSSSFGMSEAAIAGSSQSAPWGLRSVLRKVNGAGQASASSRGSTRDPVPLAAGRAVSIGRRRASDTEGHKDRAQMKQFASGPTRRNTTGTPALEPLELVTRPPLEAFGPARRELQMPEEGIDVDLQGHMSAARASGDDRRHSRSPGPATLTSDESGDDAEWQHEMITLRQEVGRAIGEAADARSAAAAAQEEADTLRKSISENGSPVPASLSLPSGRTSCNSSDPSSNKSHSDLMPTLELSLNDVHREDSRISCGRSDGRRIVPDLNLPDLTTAEVRVAELERSLRILNEDQARQHVALAAIGMRKVMSEELQAKNAEAGYGEEEEQDDADLQGSGREAYGLDRAGGNQRLRGRSVPASPRPSSLVQSRPSRSDRTPPRRRPASATTSPQTRSVRWAQSPPGSRRAKSLSPTPSPRARRHRSRSRPRRSLTPSSTGQRSKASRSPMPRRKSAGANVGRGSQGKGTRSKRQIKELRRTRKEVQQLRDEIRAKEERRQAVFEAAQLVMGASSGSLTGEHQHQQQRQEVQNRGAARGAPNQAPSFGSDILSDSSAASSPRSPNRLRPADVSLSRGVPDASSRGKGPVDVSPAPSLKQDFEFSPPRHQHRPDSSSPDGAFDLVELRDKDGKPQDSNKIEALLRSGRLMRVTSILQEMRHQVPCGLLKDAVRLCKEEAADTDRARMALERTLQSLRALAQKESNRAHQAEERLEAAQAQLSSSEGWRQQLAAAQNLASNQEQAAHKLAREKLELLDRIRDLEKSNSLVEEQSAATKDLEKRCDELRNRARTLEDELEEQRRNNNELVTRHSAGDEATATLKMKLEMSERKAEELAEELDSAGAKLKKLQANDTKKDREMFRMATDLENAQRQVAELTAEVAHVKSSLLDKSTEVIIESKRAEELQEKVTWQDEELRKITREVRNQQRELTQLREGAVKYLESRARDEAAPLGGAGVAQAGDAASLLKVQTLEAELKATQELLDGKSRELAELKQLGGGGTGGPLQVVDFLPGGANSSSQRKDPELAEARTEIASLRERLRDAEEHVTFAQRRRRSSNQNSPRQHSPYTEDPVLELPRAMPAAAPLSSSLRTSGGGYLGDGGVADAIGMGLTGADTYRAAMSRGPDSPLLSLQEIAEAPLVIRMMDTGDGPERPEVKPLNLTSSGGARIQLGSSSGRDPVASPFLSANLSESSGRPTNARRVASPLNSPRNARRSSSAESDYCERAQLAVSVPSHPRSGRSRTAANQRSLRGGLSEGNSSSDEERDFLCVPRQNAAGDAQDLAELRRRLQSFKADTAIGILGKSQAINQQLRRIQGGR